MAKFKDLEDYISTFNPEAKQTYNELRTYILGLDSRIKERLFAGQVAYYIEDTLQRTFHESPVLVLSFLKDHVNIFAMANLKYKEYLDEYSFTKKGALQVYYHQGITNPYLQNVFLESLGV